MLMQAADEMTANININVMVYPFEKVEGPMLRGMHITFVLLSSVIHFSSPDVQIKLHVFVIIGCLSLVIH